jgi:hypothetical protein
VKKLLILLLLPSLAKAMTTYSVGTYVPYFNKAQTSVSGGTQKFDLNPYLGVGTQIHMAGPHYFMPEFGYAFYLNNAKKTKKDMIFLRYDFSYIYGSNFIFRYGLTNHWYRIGGSGGNVRLRNGSGYTDFKAPSKTQTSYFTTLDMGFEYFFKKDLGLRFDLNMMSFQEMENSAFNYILTVNFYR